MITTIAQRFTENGLKTVVRILKELFPEKYRSIRDIRHVPFGVPSSVFVSSIQTHGLQSELSQLARGISATGDKKLQRMVASGSFYSANQKRLDSVMVLSKKSTQNGDPVPLKGDGSQNSSQITFECALTFLEFQDSKESERCVLQKSFNHALKKTMTMVQTLNFVFCNCINS